MNIRVILICFVVCVLVYFIGTKSLIGKIQTQNNKKEEFTRDIKATKEAIDSLNKINTLLQQKAEDVKTITLALPSDEGIPELLVMLEALYQTQGFKVTSISLGSSASNIAEVPTSITGNSSFDQLFNIFYAIQNNIRPARVKSFTASGSTDNKGITSVSSSFSLSFPYASSALKKEASSGSSSASTNTSSAQGVKQ